MECVNNSSKQEVALLSENALNASLSGWGERASKGALHLIQEAHEGIGVG